MHRLIFVSAFQACLIVCLCLWGGRIFLIGLFRSVVGLKTIVHAFLYGVTFSNIFFLHGFEIWAFLLQAVIQSTAIFPHTLIFEISCLTCKKQFSWNLIALKSGAVKGMFKSTLCSFNWEMPGTQRLEIVLSSQERGCCLSGTAVMAPNIFVNSIKRQPSEARKARGEKVAMR